jgi:hypothetical protein
MSPSPPNVERALLHSAAARHKSVVGPLDRRLLLEIEARRRALSVAASTGVRALR